MKVLLHVNIDSCCIQQSIPSMLIISKEVAFSALCVLVVTGQGEHMTFLIVAITIIKKDFCSFKPRETCILNVISSDIADVNQKVKSLHSNWIIVSWLSTAVDLAGPSRLTCSTSTFLKTMTITLKRANTSYFFKCAYFWWRVCTSTTAVCFV